MTIITVAGNYIGEGLQFDAGGGNVTAQIGRVYFAATDIVTIEVAPGAFDPITGAFIGGNGAILSLTVTTASGQVTTFDASSNGLDVDPDTSKQGADIVYVSEAPGDGVGGFYAGLKIEKLLIADQPLTANSSVLFGAGGGQVPGLQGPTPEPGTDVTGGGTPDNDILSGTTGADVIKAGAGNDRADGLGGNDTIGGGDGSDVLQGGAGEDSLSGDEGSDRLLGGDDADALDGGLGSDVLDGGAGADMLTGGADGDTFVFGPGGDTVTDFNAATGDKIVFDASLGLTALDVTLTVTAAGTVVSAGGDSVLLAGVFDAIDAGNAFKFDYIPSFDFV
jgi:Ca2+-binding RTX toxin-like protein